MITVRRVAGAVLGVLVVASLVFGLRSWIGLEPAGDDLATDAGRSSPTPSASASDGPTAPPSPSPSRSPKPAPSAQVATVPSMSTGSIETFIESRLSRNGAGAAVSCPASVPAMVGTQFRCTVAFASSPGRVVADARVQVIGPGGAVRFVSVPR